MAQRFQGIGDRSGMVTKIVDYFYAPRFTAKFLPPRNSGKTLERAVDFCLWHIIKPRRDRRHRSVAHIELAHQRNFKRLISKLKSGTFSRTGDISDSLR